MLINRLYHPLFHDAAWMWAVNVYIAICCLILEAYTRARRGTFLMFHVAEICQQTHRFFIRKVLWPLLESLYQFLLCPHNLSFLGTKVLNLVLTTKYFGRIIFNYYDMVPEPVTKHMGTEYEVNIQ